MRKRGRQVELKADQVQENTKRQKQKQQQQIKLGQGTYGTVWACECPITSRKIVIKRIPALKSRDNPCINNLKWPQTSAVREILLLSSVKHPNIIELEQVQFSSNNTTANLQLPVFDLDWYSLERQMKPPEFLSVSYQLMRALRYLHNNNICHRDIKPPNILLKQTKSAVTNENITQLVLCDLGLAKLHFPEKNQTILPAYPLNTIVTYEAYTIMYRPLDLLLENDRYGFEADQWAAGLSLYHQLCGTEDLCGATELAQAIEICERIGMPAVDNPMRKLPLWPEFMNRLTALGVVDKSKEWRMKLAQHPIGQLIQDFLLQLLHLDSRYRLTSVEACDHTVFKLFDTKTRVDFLLPECDVVVIVKDVQTQIHTTLKDKLKLWHEQYFGRSVPLLQHMIIDFAFELLQKAGLITKKTTITAEEGLSALMFAYDVCTDDFSFPWKHCSARMTQRAREILLNSCHFSTPLCNTNKNQSEFVPMFCALPPPALSVSVQEEDHQKDIVDLTCLEVLE